MITYLKAFIKKIKEKQKDWLMQFQIWTDWPCVGANSGTRKLMIKNPTSGLGMHLDYLWAREKKLLLDGVVFLDGIVSTEIT